MSHDIESNYTDDYWNEEKQCQRCDSYRLENGIGICNEGNEKVSPVGHCDFFRSID